ncbi:MAG: adenylate/guanylate cyclase domain-containing protein [Treponema sp.]|uniref:adenylate/guanylate cyclase domain-containing protein n=1 Tax=Treponema sp. TaxID=166 RepID=UPI00298ECD1D|nr:adenylate/guanylate cyclase domain-containing protein [Treponema sp.]MBR5933836.1 adenylate/guanylate cyclase domain-containing protein [Treponema sp.]
MKRAFLILVLLSVFSLYSQEVVESGKIVGNPDKLDKSYVVLDGYWEYYDKKFVDPYFFYTDGQIMDLDIRLFNGKYVKLPYRIENNVGYATYRYTLRNLKPGKEYGIFLYPSVYTCADVFVNNKNVYQSNDVSGNYNIKKSNKYMRLISFKADENGVADLVFHVANYELAFGGILLIPRVAEDTYMQSFLLHNIALELFVVGVFIILAIYNLVIFFLNKNQKMYLWLGVLSFVLICVVITLDFSLPGYLRGSIPNWINYKISLTALACIIPFYNLYSVNIYDIKFKWNFIVLIIDWLSPIFIIVAPIEIISKYLPICFIVDYIMSIYLCVLILINQKPPKYIYSFNVFNIVAMLATAAYGFLISQLKPEGNSGYYLFKGAIMSFAIIQTILAGVKRDLIAKSNQKVVDKYERRNMSYSRFIPNQIINYLQVADTEDINSGDNTICDGMILVARIRQFNKITLMYSAQQIFDIITSYYKVISPVIRLNGGFVSKYLGDTIVAIFPEKNDSVCRCAVEIERRVDGLRKELSKQNINDFRVGIAIHSGKVAVGFMGNDKRIDAVSCSDVIKNTIEIEALNIKHNSRMLISERALNYCRSYSDCLFEGVMDEIRNEKILVYKIVMDENMDFIPELEAVEEEL